jgi:hypothetical protein
LKVSRAGSFESFILNEALSRPAVFNPKAIFRQGGRHVR